MATFTNQATLSYGGVTLLSNVTTGELVEQLTAAKTSVNGAYHPGEVLTYAVSLMNAGSAEMTDLTVTDDLGAYAFGTETLYPLTYVAGSAHYFVEGVLQADPAVTAGPPLVFSGLTVPAGGSAMLIYQAQVNEYAPLGDGAQLTNTATVAGEARMSAVSASAVTPAENAPLLSLLKEMTPSRVSPGDTLSYTITVRNEGSAADAAAALVLADTLDPALSGLTVTFNGTAWTEGTQYTYDETTGAFATAAGAVTVPAAVYTQDPITGAYTVAPGESVLVLTGTV